MAKRQLTDLTVRAIRAKAKYFEVVDGTSGLRLAVFPSGAKSWIARYRRPDSGKTAKLTIGKYPAMPLSTARIRVAEARDAVGNGADPGVNKRRKKIEDRQAETDRAADTVAKHAQAFLDWQAKRLRPGGWKQQQHVIRDFVLPAWGSKSVHDVRKRDVIELVEGIAEDRPVMANRALGVIGRFYHWMRERDVVTFSPTDGVRKPSVERSRDRALSPAEIEALWHALDTVGGPTAAAAKVMLLTGQRRGEVSGMRWSELAGDVWSLPKERTKNGRPHAIGLPRQALAVIEQRPRIVDTDYVFAAGRKPVADFSRIKLAVDRVMKPESPWTLHDLRRSCASGLQRLGVRGETIERALNHVSGLYRGVAGIYQRDPLTEEVRDALARWADFVERTVTGEEPGKVVKFGS
jgi:integrase